MRAPELARRLLTPITPGAARAVVMLFVLSFLLAAASMLFTVYEVSASDHKFCAVVSGFTAVRVPAPADPKADPSRERQYEWYQRFVRLGRDLGCCGVTTDGH